MKEHIDRLYQSTHTLLLTIPLTKEEIIEKVIRTVRINDFVMVQDIGNTCAKIKVAG